LNVERPTRSAFRLYAAHDDDDDDCDYDDDHDDDSARKINRTNDIQPFMKSALFWDSTRRNIPEERRSQHRGGSLKSRFSRLS
jgi:hypothetical protein